MNPPPYSDGYHLRCAGIKGKKLPQGEWFCSPCLRVTSATYRQISKPRLNKGKRRQEAGLFGVDDPTPEMIERFLQAGLDPSTVKKKDRAQRDYRAFCDERQYDLGLVDSLILFVMRRVQAGVAYQTIKGECSAASELLRPSAENKPKLFRAMRATKRLADVPHEQKLPLTVSHMHSLKRAIAEADIQLSDREGELGQGNRWHYLYVFAVTNVSD